MGKKKKIDWIPLLRITDLCGYRYVRIYIYESVTRPGTLKLRSRYYTVPGFYYHHFFVFDPLIFPFLLVDYYILSSLLNKVSVLYIRLTIGIGREIYNDTREKEKYLFFQKWPRKKKKKSLPARPGISLFFIHIYGSSSAHNSQGGQQEKGGRLSIICLRSSLAHKTPLSINAALRGIGGRGPFSKPVLGYTYIPIPCAYACSAPYIYTTRETPTHFTVAQCASNNEKRGLENLSLSRCESRRRSHRNALCSFGRR